MGTTAAVATGATLPTLLAAAVFGACTPPVNLAVRPCYARAVDDDPAATARLHQLDSVVLETVELTAPVLVGLLLALGQVAVAVGVVAVTMSGSALVLARSPLLRRPREPRDGGPAAPARPRRSGRPPCAGCCSSSSS